MSNLPGPGRLLGNFYSWAGLPLERQLGKLAYRTGLGSFAKAEAILRRSSAVYDIIKDGDMTKAGKACDILLRFAMYCITFFSFGMLDTDDLFISLQGQTILRSRS